MKSIVSYKNNAKNLVTHIHVVAQKLFYTLCEEYELHINNVELLLVEEYKDYLNSMWNDRYSKYVNTAEELLYEINDNIYENGFIYNCYDWDEEEKRLKHKIVLNYQNIMNLLLANIDLTKAGINMELIEQYLEIVFRHEFGHILYHNYIMDNFGMDKFEECVKENDKEMNEYNQYCSDMLNGVIDVPFDTFDEEFDYRACNRYYNITEEVKANEFAKIDTNELIRLELLVRCQVDVNA